MDIYHLYLDESETFNTNGRRAFCIAGIVVKAIDHDQFVKPELDRIKQAIWHDLSDPTSYVLHEKDVRFAQNHKNRYKLHEINSEFHRFRSGLYSRMLYSRLDQLFQQKLLTVVGASIVIDTLYSYFDRDIISDKYLIGMQILFENFCLFLKRNDAVGYVFSESREEHQDREVEMKFHHIKAMGSMYISPYAMQKHLKEINFPKKTDNIAGLQVADFVPNNFARKSIGNEKHKYNIYDSLRKAQYDGGLLRHDRFGVKIMP